MNERRSPGHNGERTLVAEAKAHAAILGGFIGLLWVIQLVNTLVFQGALVGLGIQPRTLAGLWGILFAPFLHGGFAHLIANTVPLAVLGWFVMLRRKRDLFLVSAITALVGGLGTWLIGPALSIHVGASVLVFGYLGYLICRGLFERRFWPIVGSLIVLFFFGGALHGVLPGAVGISWQMHLFGLLGGVLAARLLGTPRVAVAAPRRAEPARRRISISKARVSEGPGVEVVDEDIEAELERARAQMKARQL